jgi:hypothetical protein
MGSPLKFSYDLGAQGKIKTTVSGDNRDIANIEIYNVNTLLYSVNLNSVQLEATIPDDLIMGSLTIMKGGTLKMTVPSNYQSGQVQLHCMLKSCHNDPTPFAAQVATWPLSS